MFSWRLPCPHCNGPNDVAMDRHCLSCKYCGAGLWIRCPDAFPTVAATARIDQREAIFRWDQHLKECRRPLSSQGRSATLLHLPFWHIRALVAIHHLPHPAPASPARQLFTESGDLSGLWGSFQQQNDHQDSSEAGWEIKPWDLSFPGFAEGLSGMDSLGVRTQTISLSGCSNSPSSDADRWVSATGQADDAVARLSAAVAALSADAHPSSAVASRIIAPQVSLIYWPVWILSGRGTDAGPRVEIDAVSGRLIRETPTAPKLPEPAAKIDGEPPRLLPHRCPECGADLPVDVTLTVFPCSNCGVLIAHVGSGDRRTISCVFANGTAGRESMWYPFWAFEPDQLLVPAFPIRNPRALVRFGAIVSGQKRAFSTPANPPTRLMGVSLMPDVAAGMAALICEQKSHSPKPLTDLPPRLVFIPLNSEGSELTDPATGLCLPRAALATSE